MVYVIDPYEHILDLYGVEYGVEPVPFEEFIEALEPERPAYPFAAASAERNMFVLSRQAAAIRAGLNPFNERIRRVLAQKLALTPVTNRAGD
jgi:hypothetical protein